ncbi:MAG TPA: glycosyltransferase family 39 protein [Candidatus Hydrogenedentes bacterium]|nr:glycosyltransferase family 39 protein [Candidatus Hydrogenedentota bacterium]HPG66959.1 glycosyltransferase family 39 protein [Candidatus Hydrogenedentota bacterium]
MGRLQHDKAAAEPAGRPRAAGRPSQPRRNLGHGAWTTGILLLAAALRLYGLTRNPLWYDETVHAAFCRHLTWPILACREILVEPFFCLFLNLWLRLGASDLWIRLYAALIGFLVVVTAYRTGKRMAGPRGGLYGALLTACAPFLVFYSRDAKMYAWVMLLELVATGCTLRYVSHEGSRRDLVAYGVTAILLLHTHLVAPFYLVALNAGFLLFLRAQLRKTLAWFGVQVVVILATTPYFLAQYHYWRLVQGIPFFAPRPTAASLVTTAANLFIGYAAHAWIRGASVVILACLVLASIGLLRGKRAEAGLLIGTALGQVVLLFLFSTIGGKSFYVDRYLVGSAAPILIVCGAGLARIERDALRRTFTAVPLVFFALGLGDLYAYRFSPDTRDHLGVFPTYDARALRDAIRAAHRPHDAVWHLAWEELAPLRWYLPEADHRLVDMGGRLEANIDAVMPPAAQRFYGFGTVEVEDAFERARRVWLVVPLDTGPFFGVHEGIRAWIEARAHCERREVFAGRFAPVALYLYTADKPPGESRNTAWLPLKTTVVSHDDRPPLIVTTLEPKEGASMLVAENRSRTHRSLEYEVAVSTAGIDATAFDRILRDRSAWRLQCVQGDSTARMAYYLRAGAQSRREDILSGSVPSPEGLYEVFFERLACGSGSPVRGAIMELAVGRQQWTVAGEVFCEGCRWQWERMGTVENEAGRNIDIRVAARRPDGATEAVAAFSRIAFLPEGALPSPRVDAGTMNIAAEDVIRKSITNTGLSLVEVTLIADGVCASVWRRAD